MSLLIIIRVFCPCNCHICVRNEGGYIISNEDNYIFKVKFDESSQVVSIGGRKIQVWRKKRTKGQTEKRKRDDNDENERLA